LLERVYREEQASLKEGVNFTVDMVHEIISRVVSSTVLEALAVELVLKVRLSQADKPIPMNHKHVELFDLLSLSERKESGQRYRASRHPAMRATIEEALAFSSDVFERWRYIHEHQSVEASMGEMQRAFNALAHNL
jgi:hypothetical protein